MSQAMKVDPDLGFIRELRKQGGDSLKKCYQCATCSVVCELSQDDRPFPRKEMLWAQWGLKDRLMADPDVWTCYQCNDCSTHCPRGAKPGDVLGSVRASVIQSYAYPRFLARAMYSPMALPVLLGLAVLLVGVLVWFTGRNLESWGLSAPLPEQALDGARFDGGYFANFLAHGPIDAIFVALNMIVFAFAAISLSRFWKDMKAAYGKPDSPGFIPCAIEALKEILFHTKFKDCSANKTRYIAHLLVFYGFVGAMITTGVVFMGLIFLDFYSPIPLTHPVKILGNLSLFGIVLGCLIMMVRRVSSKDTAGSSSYGDWLFLITLFVVAVTGGLTQLGRIVCVNEPAPAYIAYFIHMVSVFFLLCYMPYSKFAHMLYRTLGIAFGKSIDVKK
jgi:quinone-modifying oxidoreductase subunit QmoC